MATKEYKVLFARTSMGQNGDPITQALRGLFQAHGAHFPIHQLMGEKYQLRGLRLVGTVWTGCFVKLRDDAPHVVDSLGDEHQLNLDAGSHIIEKCHLMYREQNNVLVWQVNRSAAGLTRLEQYLSAVMSQAVLLPLVMNEAELQRMLDGQVYEVDFVFDRPQQLGDGAPQWSRQAFDMMSSVDAAHAKFSFRAERAGWLSDPVKHAVQEMRNMLGIGRLKVRLTDDTDPIELFLAPLRDTIQVPLLLRYPNESDVFTGLEEAYTRNAGSIPHL